MDTKGVAAVAATPFDLVQSLVRGVHELDHCGPQFLIRQNRNVDAQSSGQGLGNSTDKFAVSEELNSIPVAEALRS